MPLTTWCLRASNATVDAAPITRQPNNGHVPPHAQAQSRLHLDSDKSRNAIRIFWINISNCPRAHHSLYPKGKPWNEKGKVMTNRELKRSCRMRPARMGQTLQSGLGGFSVWSSCPGSATFSMVSSALTQTVDGATLCHLSALRDRTAKPLRSKRCSDGG